ncbi:MAG: DUF349 domain-containing protein [Gammaproteobacteria bacterium]|nr:DUF349 domain-containing protein [Gammaproteobacteria bacterium]
MGNQLFERFLGSKFEHSDPLVRAKAYATGTVDEDTLSAALANETAPQVLQAVVTKSQDVGAILAHTNSASAVAPSARARLVALTELADGKDSAVWKQVFERAITEQWPELPQLVEGIRSDSGFEHVAQGALLASATVAPDLLTPALLENLVTHSHSSPVRQAAARLITDPQTLENCCREIKDKDKSVYRDVKTRLDAHKERERARALAVTLEAACTELDQTTIVAQPESIATVTARLQKLEDQVGEISAGGEGLEEVTSLEACFSTINAQVKDRIAAAREVLTTRRELQSTLSALARTADSTDTATADHEQVERLRALWKELPDSSDLETRRFNDQADSVAGALLERQNNLDVSAALSEQLDVWERTTNPRDPEKARKHIDSKWESFEKPRDEALLAPLKHRYELVCEALHIKEQQHQQKRSENSEALVALLDEFKAAVSNGDLKLATSCHAKLKHRLNTELLETRVRKQAEADLKHAQPQLDEYRKWRHFGTIQARENLIGEANKLVTDPPASPNKVAEQVKQLRESWKKLDQGDGRSSSTQWETFSELLKQAYKPAKKHFKNLSKERKTNEKLKREIIRTLEELHANTDWQNPEWPEVCQIDKDARLQWQKTGVVDYKVRKELDQAFSQATVNLDAAMHDERDREVRRRERLIAQLQKEKSEGDIRSVAESAKRMQRNWRPTVQADRKTEQRLWTEFRTVCDEVFKQLKEEAKAEKEAWHAEADQRRSACDALEALLKEAPGTDDRALNLARGQAEEIRKDWRKRSTIPKAVFHKLERRFNDAMKAYQQRARQIRRHHEARRQDHLEQMAQLCQQAEQLAVETAPDAQQRAELQAAWSAGAEHMGGSAAKMLISRYSRAEQAMDGSEQHRQAIERSFEKNLRKREQLCLLGELIADLPSPPDYADQRMQLQVERLKNALEGGVGEKRQELQGLITQWFELGGVAAPHWQQLQERFSRIREAASQ